MTLRTLRSDEWNQLASLIFQSTNDWYHRNLNRTCFPGDDPMVCRLFPEVYEALDPGCCLVAEIEGQLAGSCFYHPRETHLSLGIMNAHPDFAGRGVARALLAEIIKKAGDKPVRLVSSALNLDSFSLYSRAGFRPFAIYQDMIIPADKDLPTPSKAVRQVCQEDLPAILALEKEVSGIERKQDWLHFLENKLGVWRGLVFEKGGLLDGFLFSIDHPGSRMLGPGTMHSEEAAFELIVAHLADFREHPPLFLVPASASELIQKLYRLGARNCEIHLGQALGGAKTPRGIAMPTFMPETG